MTSRWDESAGRRSTWPLLVVCLGALAALLVAACSPARAPAPAAPARPPERSKPAPTAAELDQIDVYELVIRRVCGPDDTAGGKAPKPVIYILASTDDRAADPVGSPSGQPKLPASVREVLTARLADLPGRVRWADSFDAVPLERQTGAPEGGGCIVTLGDIVTLADGSVRVPASIYFTNLGAGGTTYVLKRTAGRWAIVGTTGGMWVS